MARTNQIQVRRGSATQWSNTNPVLASGEPGFDTTNNLLKIGDGTSTWTSLSSNVGVGDAGLLSIASLTTASGSYLYATANDVYTTGTITTFGRSLVDDADASTARTTLGLGTLATQSGTFSGTSSGTNTGDQTAASLGLTIGTNAQANDAGLTSIAGLTTESGNYIYATANDVYTTGVITSFGRSLVDDADASTSRTTLGLAIGTDVQAYDAGLLSIAALTTAADRYIYTTANDVYTTGVITSFGRSLVDDADASTCRTTLGLGTLATQSGTFSGTSSGTNTGDQTAASLSLTIGTNVQAYDAGLTSIAALTTVSGSYLYTTANDVYTTGIYTEYGRSLLASSGGVESFVTAALTAGTGIVLSYNSGTDTATINTSGLVIGTNVQAYDAGLLSIAGLTTASGSYLYATANDVYTTGAITTFARSLVDDADASTSRTTLGLAIGTNVQAYDSLFASRLAGGRISVQASSLGGGIIPDADRTGNIIIRYYHFTHGYIGLYDTTNSVWVPYSISNSAGGLNVSTVRLDTPAVTADANYDLFINYIGTPNEMALSINIWASDTTRATAISLQDGVYVKTSDKSYRYVGTLRTTSSTTTEDSKKRRFVWNYNNRVPHAIYAGQYSIHSYATATWRAFNSNTTPGEGRFEFVTGLAEDAISVNLNSSFTCGNIALALDSITTPTNLILTKTSTTDYRTFSTSATFDPQIGYHYIQSLEKGISANTSFTNVNMEQGLFLC